MTRRELYTLKTGDILIGPLATTARFWKHDRFVRGRPKYVELQMLPTYALESWSIDHLLDGRWVVATPEQAETIKLLYQPIDNLF